MSASRNAVFRVGEILLHEHERTLIKRTAQILNEKDLLAGSPDEVPNKSIKIPNYCEPGREIEEHTYSYKMLKQDQHGEKKVRYDGLLIGRHYLFNVFTLESRHPVYFVLVTDLMKTLSVDSMIDEDEFLRENKELFPQITSDDEASFLKEVGLLESVNNSEFQKHKIKFVSARSAFIKFGAAVVASGQRVNDDYWENEAKIQGFNSHHRVFKLSKKQLNILKLLNPGVSKIKETKQKPTSQEGQNWWLHFEQPYSTITEHPQSDIKEDYEKLNEIGDQQPPLIPGQNISGSLELSAQFKVPRYHSKNSFLQATQLNALDIPIGEHEKLRNEQSNETSASVSENGPISNNFQSQSHSQSPIPSAPVNKPLRRMLSSILDNNVNSIKVKRSEEQEALNSTAEITTSNSSLNIDGWKFESLPLIDRTGSGEVKFSGRGLPFYNKSKILNRLAMLTPNEIKELEHFHDAVFFNTGIQKVRKIRKQKWLKYWQYKMGIPIGLKSGQVESFFDRGLPEIIQRTSTKQIFNEATNTDEIYTTKRIANANFHGNCNISGLFPPYVLPPPGPSLEEQ
ncbi:uncharacterized protein HLK63_K12661 [Nakaseomyces glabratus]|nr:hypothetical protein B1J91_K12936g [Nakaseomyces glabratus]OXB47160.1 hypothetical protein B1J92_K12936g [Nakaseomyces glabratus]UCS22585.1 uncharacterized protein GW608_K12661 [Nakaseomyces glabratus]UCS27817.1 uncharacterized protein HLK63_K12661 [Nakaseomyces glabratus]UCS33046.1 uncharacterized protein HLK64_K12661 [Nakaseomyces glabratus]